MVCIVKNLVLRAGDVDWLIALLSVLGLGLDLLGEVEDT